MPSPITQNWILTEVCPILDLACLLRSLFKPLCARHLRNCVCCLIEITHTSIWSHAIIIEGRPSHEETPIGELYCPQTTLVYKFKLPEVQILGVFRQGQGHPARSKVKYTGKKVHFLFCHSIWSNRDRHLICGVQVHIFSDKSLRSRSFFKVKGQI